MASWRTHNKRARRKRERDARFMRDADKLLEALSNRKVESELQRVFENIGKALADFAIALHAAVVHMNTVSQGWQPLDPRYARLRRQEEWPDVILDDILDAEFVE